MDFTNFYGFQLYFIIDLQIFSVLTRYKNLSRKKSFKFAHYIV